MLNQIWPLRNEGHLRDDRLVCSALCGVYFIKVEIKKSLWYCLQVKTLHLSGSFYLAEEQWLSSSFDSTSRLSLFINAPQRRVWQKSNLSQRRKVVRVSSTTSLVTIHGIVLVIEFPRESVMCLRCALRREKTVPLYFMVDDI